MPIVGTWIMLYARDSTSKLKRSERLLHLHNEFSHRLAKTTTWEELIDAIVEFPSTILPVIQTSLHLYDPDQQVLNFSGAWNASGPGMLPIPPVIQAQDYPPILLESPTIAPYPRNMPVKANYSSNFSRYAMSLFHRDELIGLLHIDLPANLAQEDNLIEDLSSGAQEIALALSNALIGRHHTNRQQVLDDYRRRIAKDIHDTLGQNIAYLRLKLDRLVESGELQDIEDVHRELEQMRAVADAAYTNMRGALDALQPVGFQQPKADANQEFPTSLLNQAQAIGRRGNLKVNLEMNGKPRRISPAIQRQILLITGEAMHNIEKHAGAKNITLCLSWEDTQLKLDIIDDGCGFCSTQGPAGALRNGHYGLSIMQERAHEINGQLAISSQAGLGTSISLNLPIPTGNGYGSTH